MSQSRNAPDWTVEADGYRLVIEGGAIIGLAYDEWPWPWGDPRYRAYETVTSVVTDGREVWTSETWRQPQESLSGPKRPSPLREISPHARP